MAESWSGGEVGEVGRSSTKLVPERGRGIARKPHRPGLAKYGSVDAFDTPVLSGCVGSRENVIYAERSTPIQHRFGDKFPIIGYKRFEGKASLSRHMFVPQTKHRSGVPLASQGQAPDVTGEIIDYVHGIQTTRA